jgi:hypothetical protein
MKVSKLQISEKKLVSEVCVGYSGGRRVCTQVVVEECTYIHGLQKRNSHEEGSYIHRL